jgi:hypothetical protein
MNYKKHVSTVCAIANDILYCANEHARNLSYGVQEDNEHFVASSYTNYIDTLSLGYRCILHHTAFYPKTTHALLACKLLGCTTSYDDNEEHEAEAMQWYYTKLSLQTLITEDNLQ